MHIPTPFGMNRRHFLRHLATSAATIPALQFLSHLHANAAEVKRNQKACILVWLNGGPPTIDMWDLKPGSKNGGEFKPVGTKGDLQISDQLPETAKIMDTLAVIRSMSTREADHTRGRYYMHTAYVPNPTVVHPTFGSVVSYELGAQRTDLKLPSFISVGGASGSPGFMGMMHAPFVVQPNGDIRNSDAQVDAARLRQRLGMLKEIESSFISSRRGETPQAHMDVYQRTIAMMTSDQMEAFRVTEEPPQMRQLYGDNTFGSGLTLARRLVEKGVPFVEVTFPGSWDLHDDVFNRLRTDMLPRLDRGLSGLMTDLRQRGLLDHTVVVVMGEFGRTPRINQNVGRDHWASSWSVVIGGGGLKGGQAIGETDADGLSILGQSYTPGDVWATVAHALGIPLDRVHTSKRGRPMRIANGGSIIKELVG